MALCFNLLNHHRDITFSDKLFQDRGGCTVEDFCNHIHRSLVKEVKYVLVWGVSARHYPQHCGLSHVLRDEDVVQIVKKKVSKTTLYLVFYCLIDFCIIFQILYPFLLSDGERLNVICLIFQDKEGEGRGRFKSHSTAPARISDREKKAPLKQ